MSTQREQALVKVSVLPTLPIIREPAASVPAKYGEDSWEMTVGKGADGQPVKVKLDKALFTGTSSLRLKHINQCLKLMGYKKVGLQYSHADKAVFNKTVRDVWHKVVRYATQDALRNAQPVSIGASKRTTKRDGTMLTTRLGFEQQLVKPVEDPKAIAEKAARKQSKQRAKRQRRKGLVNVGASLDTALTAPLRESAPQTPDARTQTPVIG